MNQSSARPNPPPPRMTVGVPGWIRTNLFSSPTDGIITIVLGAVLALAAIQAVNWVFLTADWTVITSRLPLYIIGRYPQELYWRPLTALLLISVLLGMTWRIWGGLARNFAIALIILTLLAAILPYSPLELSQIGPDETPSEPKAIVSILFTLNIVAVAVGYGLATLQIFQRPRNFIFAAIGSFIISALLVIGSSYVPGLEPVPTQDLGGLTLNLLLAAVGIVCSIPIGILLALGRRSQLPVLKVACVGFIEIVRGVPLITLLFMSRHILPLTFPESVSIDELYLAMITITLFSSAYMAENVRGGMAAVATGQTEAARALGLRAWQTTTLITLPQGLRNIIPAIVGQAIGLFKDTSLVFIIGMLDLVEMGRVTIQGNLEFVDDGHEVYIFIAAVFWVFTFSMSYVSRKIETALGVGQR